jgi:orotate phosphoribosyltransferase
MQDYQEEFIEFALSQGVLQFGEFTLKSGRISPYFFNSGLFNNGASLWQLGDFYARAIRDSGIEFDMLFGPAYKGIPLAAAVAIVLAQRYQRTCPYGFDRKEIKDHGEGGLTVGAPLRGRVLIIDDVISAGTSINHSVGLIRGAGATPVGVAIALDRQETGPAGDCAITEIEQNHGIKVISIIKLENLIDYLQARHDQSEHLGNINQYRKKYGIKC